MTDRVPAKAMNQLKELQVIDFAITELTLYLDTHPDDAETLGQLKELSEKRVEMKDKVEQVFGPLRVGDPLPKDAKDWVWSKAPWPWQL